MLDIGWAYTDASWGILALFFLAGTSVAAKRGHGRVDEKKSTKGAE